MQAQKDAFNRRHNDHQHSMTLSIPRKDSRAMDIPSDTIQPLGKRRVSLPFRYLRTWIFSLLALVFLPIGIGLVMIGIEMQENLLNDWEEVTATVTRNDERGVEYDIDNGDDGDFAYELDDMLAVDAGGKLVATVSICDLVSRFIIPKENGTEFPLWVDINKSSNQSCVPINDDFSALYIIIGSILAMLSGLRLIRTFHAAGLRPVK